MLEHLALVHLIVQRDVQHIAQMGVAVVMDVPVVRVVPDVVAAVGVMKVVIQAAIQVATVGVMEVVQVDVVVVPDVVVVLGSV